MEHYESYTIKKIQWYKKLKIFYYWVKAWALKLASSYTILTFTYITRNHEIWHLEAKRLYPCCLGITIVHNESDSLHIQMKDVISISLKDNEYKCWIVWIIFIVYHYRYVFDGREGGPFLHTRLTPVRPSTHFFMWLLTSPSPHTWTLLGSCSWRLSRVVFSGRMGGPSSVE